MRVYLDKAGKPTQVPEGAQEEADKNADSTDKNTLKKGEKKEGGAKKKREK